MFCYEAKKYIRHSALSLIQNFERSRETHAFSDFTFSILNGKRLKFPPAFPLSNIQISRGREATLIANFDAACQGISDLAIRTRDGSVLEWREGCKKKNSWRERERDQGGSETRLRLLVYSRDPLYEDGPFARDKALVKSPGGAYRRVSPTIVICRRYIKLHYQYLEGGAAAAALAARLSRSPSVKRAGPRPRSDKRGLARAVRYRVASNDRSS